jgi:post-segregation antitoxin (ccd killing protein)
MVALENRDRVESKLVLDSDLKAVLEFMQGNISAGKLIGIAEAIPQTARLLWAEYPQEPFSAAALLPDLPEVNTSCETPLTSTE